MTRTSPSRRFRDGSARCLPGRPIAGAGPFWEWIRPFRWKALRMRELVAAGRQSVVGPGPIGSRSGGLRLLLPWDPHEAAYGEEGHSWPDDHTRWASNRRRLAIVSAAELELGRPSAMVVMQLILDAWRSAERQLGETVDGSLERSRIQAQVATLRSLYQGLFAQVRYAQTGRAETGGS